MATKYIGGNFTEREGPHGTYYLVSIKVEDAINNQNDEGFTTIVVRDSKDGTRKVMSVGEGIDTKGIKVSDSDRYYSGKFYEHKGQFGDEFVMIVVPDELYAMANDKGYATLFIGMRKDLTEYNMGKPKNV